MLWRTLMNNLSASVQLCTEANEILYSQKASLAELTAQVDEEREQRREEREKAALDLKLSIQSSDRSPRGAETTFGHCLETRKGTTRSNHQKVEELEHEAEKLRKELENVKAAREEAWAKVSALELEINAEMRDIDFERRRLKGARERIMLRETQLRVYSTTEEISSLFANQQEQLKAMQRTLEDEENYENTSVDFDLKVTPYRGDINGTLAREKQATANQINSADNAGSGPSIRRCCRNQLDNTSSDEASVTESMIVISEAKKMPETHRKPNSLGVTQIVKGGWF
ncbi:hypothetical protein RHMOL_Rhmol07G0030300 [Rhododendron molle]|uniref:Uncharacterized protein n=1 Tax=Rhododendron molle TaxID=49168 RepID=A0ACC0MX20_RHOML|nr:hypothetical protein RHMOL_Rhmol07G0030300 [Rhododendron molle]